MAGSRPLGSRRSKGTYQHAASGADPAQARWAKDLEKDVRRIIRELDGEGRWITTYAGERLVGQPKFGDSFRYISSDVFSRNVETLAKYVAARGK